MRLITLTCIFVSLMLLAVSCQSFTSSPVEAQLSRGQAIYQSGCATSTCHGVNGEGIRTENGFRDWPLVGEEFQRRNPTAQVLFDVVRSGGEASLRALTDQQVYDSIAYELSLNKVEFPEVLTAENAPFTPGGSAAGAQNPGSLFPPPGNANLLPARPVPALPISAENGDLRLRLTQIAQATSIGNIAAPDAGSFVIMVFNLEVFNQAREVSPEHLRLVTGTGQVLAPLEIGLAYPVTRFHPQNIQPEHGTAAYVVFALPANARLAQLLYTFPDGQRLIVDLSQ